VSGAAQDRDFQNHLDTQDPFLISVSRENATSYRFN
jgi:hypothetical protein